MSVRPSVSLPKNYTDSLTLTLTLKPPKMKISFWVMTDGLTDISNISIKTLSK